MRAAEKTALLTQLVKDKHREQVVVPECKTGPSMVGGCPRMDVWVMYKSWANPRVLCYEVKTSRRDFLNDDKWRSYLPYCNEFWFATVPGVIEDPSEIPEEAGWLLAAKTMTRAYTKKKAPFRDVDIPESLWRYILMCRTDIVSEQIWNRPGASRQEHLEYWRAWLAEKEECRKIGHMASHALSKKYHDDVRAVQYEQERIEKRLKRVREVEGWLGELNIHISSWSPDTKEKLADMIRRANVGVPEQLVRDVKRMSEDLAKVHKVMDALMKGDEEKD